MSTIKIFIYLKADKTLLYLCTVIYLQSQGLGMAKFNIRS